MKIIIGILLILGGIALGIWLGIWVCLVGGIVQLIEAVKATPIESFGIAWGIARILLTSVVGWGSFAICAFAGGAFLSSGSRRW